MKKILSLVLVVAMLLSVAPMTWAADQDVGTATEPKHYASLVLKDSIAINFKSTRAWLEAQGVTKAEFTMGDEVVQTIDGIPAGDSELAVFPFTKLTPAQMAEDVTLSYYAGETLVKTLTSSVLDYCTDACADANESPLLKTALVDMLNYGAAAMTYNNETVDADLQTALTTYASNATTTEPTLSNKTALTGDAGTVVWLSAGLNLKDSVSLRFKFSAESVEGLTLKLTCNGQTWEITKFYPVEGNEGQYYAYFNGLNPAQLRDLVYGEFYLDGAAVSNKLTYSVESYAAADDGADENLTALTKSLMTYGDAVYNWAYTYLAGSDLTYIEAEDVILFTGKDSTFNNQVPVTVVDDTVQFGIPWGYQSYTSEGDTSQPAHLSFKVNASAAGTYYIWAKVKRLTASDETDHFCYIDGIQYSTLGTDYSETSGWQYNQWSAPSTGEYEWVKIATCAWEAGETYSVRLRARKNVAVIDQFVVTSNAAEPHDHVYSTEWSSDETHHWYNCTVDGCTAAKDKAEHDYGTTGVCECGKVGFYVAGSTDTYIEAENVNLFTGKDTTLNAGIANVVKVADNSSASGGKVASWGWTSSLGHKDYTDVGGTDLTANPAHISFDVKASATGTYYVWMKESHTTDSASCFAYVDGDTSVAAGWQYQGYGATCTDNTVFNWVLVATCEWQEGETYSVRIRHRQSGEVQHDQFLVTSSAAEPHDHVYSTEWSSDADNHWYNCTVEGCTAVKDKAEHTHDNDADTDCNICGETRHIHAYSDVWTTDDTYHWHACTGSTDCTNVADKAEHDYGTTGVCECGKVGFYVAGNVTYIEAEDANLFAGYDTTYSSKAYPVTVVDDTNASGGQGVQLGDGTTGRGAASSNSNAHPAHISFNVKATETKTYRLWVLAKEWSDDSTVSSNIFWCYNTEGTTDMVWTYFGTNKGAGYVWYSTTIDMVEGETYTIGFRPRDQYIVIDQFCISYNSYSQPTE